MLVIRYSILVNAFLVWREIRSCLFDGMGTWGLVVGECNSGGVGVWGLVSGAIAWLVVRMLDGVVWKRVLAKW